MLSILVLRVASGSSKAERFSGPSAFLRPLIPQETLVSRALETSRRWSGSDNIVGARLCFSRESCPDRNTRGMQTWPDIEREERQGRIRAKVRRGRRSGEKERSQEGRDGSNAATRFPNFRTFQKRRGFMGVAK